MRFFLLAFILFLTSAWGDYQWTAPASNSINTPNAVSVNIATYYLSSGSQLMQIWQGNDNYFYYATYENHSFGTATVIDTSQVPLTGLPVLGYDTGSSNLFLIYQNPDSSLASATYSGGIWAPNANVSTAAVVSFSSPISFGGNFIELWTDRATGDLMYNTFTDEAWTGATSSGLMSGTSSVLLNPISFTYMGETSLIQMWYDSEGNLVGASTDESLETWTFLNTTVSDVSMAFDPLVYEDTIIVVYLNQDNDLQTVTTSNGSSWTILPSSIADAVYSSGPPFLEPISNQPLIVWIQNGIPYYSIFDGEAWATANTIPLGVAPTTNSEYNYLVYDSSTNQTLVLWGVYNSGNYNDYYSTYDGSTWTTPSNNLVPLGSSVSTSNAASVAPTYDPSNDQLIFVWQDSTTGNLYYAYYASMSPVPPPPAPANLSLVGTQKSNNFGIVKELYNVLVWRINSPATAYYLYRNGTLIATLNGNTYTYEDHKQPSSTQTYTLEASLEEGSQVSTSVTVGK